VQERQGCTCRIPSALGKPCRSRRTGDLGRSPQQAAHATRSTGWCILTHLAGAFSFARGPPCRKNSTDGASRCWANPTGPTRHEADAFAGAVLGGRPSTRVGGTAGSYTHGGGSLGVLAAHRDSLHTIRLARRAMSTKRNSARPARRPLGPVDPVSSLPRFSARQPGAGCCQERPGLERIERDPGRPAGRLPRLLTDSRQGMP
jgi:hypothetical protein